MALINKKYFEGGEKLTAANLNAPYDTLASTTVQGVNTADKWANRDYINEAGPDLNKVYHDYNNGATPFSTNSTSSVVVTNGADARTITTTHTCVNRCLLRVWADGTIGIPTYEQKDYSGGNPPKNLYQFTLQVTFNGSSVRRIHYGNWSFGALSGVLGNGAPAAAQSTINYRNFGISGATLFQPGDVINKIELLAKVGDAANTIVIGRNALFVTISEN
tara:strand:- start:520 stop:1176 length:657 start_codon:yes stop_codon:yes gene_type:complete